MTQDFFELFGLPRRFDVDLGELERRYLAASRAAHPDFHAGGSDADRRASLERTAAVNQAYLALKDPVRRAEHLLGLHGGPTAQQEKSLDQAFLADMLDLRERIEEVKAAGGPAADAVEADLTAREADLITAVAAALDRPAGPAELRSARRALNAVRTVRSLLRDLREA